MPECNFKDDKEDYEYTRPPQENRNTIPVTLELCADVRKEDCAFFFQLNVETPFMAISQGFCGWNFRTRC